MLAHQSPAELAILFEFWRPAIKAGALLLAFGGTRENFERTSFEPRIFITDPRLRTRDHQREHQSMTGVFQAVRHWLHSDAGAWEFIHFAESDHLPLIADLNEQQVKRMNQERADVLAFHLQRIDGTSHPHYLYHRADPRFHAFFESVSVRQDTSVVLAALGAGSFWRREAFEAVAAIDEPFPMYFEVYLPTLAHHLGFRLRDWSDQNQYVLNKGDRGAEIDDARRAGAWTLHPVKTFSA